jgi:hypothetical protein
MKTLFRKYSKGEIEAKQTAKGGYSRKSLASLGVHWPPKKGWKLKLLRGKDPNGVQGVKGNNKKTKGKVVHTSSDPIDYVPDRSVLSKYVTEAVYSPLQEEAEPVAVVEEPVELRKRFCTRYPWSRWFAAKRVILRKGVDYGATQMGMVQNIRAASRRLGVKVSIRVTDTSITMRVVG